MATEYMAINELKEFDCNIYVYKKNTKPSPACRNHKQF